MKTFKQFTVDSTCIACGRCFEQAPNNFQENCDDGAGRSFVYCQPDNEQDEEDCEIAIDLCPVEAIDYLEE